MNPESDPKRVLDTLGSRISALGAVALLVALPLAACGSDDDDAGGAEGSGAEATAADVTVSDPWARSAAAGGNAAVYMALEGGAQDDELVGVSVPTDIAADAQLHETVTDDDMAEDDMADDDGDGEMHSDDTDDEGHSDEESDSDAMAGGDDMSEGEMSDDGDSDGSPMMSMQQVQSIPVPAGGTVELAPGGLHIMLFDLGSDLVAGDTVEVTLNFASGLEEKVEAEVRDA